MSDSWAGAGNVHNESAIYIYIYIYFHIRKQGAAQDWSLPKDSGANLKGLPLARVGTNEHQKEYNCKGLKTFLFCFISWIQDCINNNTGFLWRMLVSKWIIMKTDKERKQINHFAFPLETVEVTLQLKGNFIFLSIPTNKWRRNDTSSLLLIPNGIKDLGRDCLLLLVSNKRDKWSSGLSNRSVLHDLDAGNDRACIRSSLLI